MERIVDFFAPVSALDALVKFLVFEALIGPSNVFFYHGVLGAPMATLNLTILSGFFVSAPFIALALAMLAHLRRLRTQLAHLATTDMLTGLPNRRAFLERIADGAILRDSGTFLMVDLDHFKRINDTYGHQTGDLCLCAVADFIRGVAGDPMTCARLGGEEFGLFLPAGTEGADLLAWRLATGLTVRTDAAEDVALTMSVGLKTAAGGTPVSHVMSHADQALYRAKAQGRARAEVWTACGDVVLGALGAPAA